MNQQPYQQYQQYQQQPQPQTKGQIAVERARSTRDNVVLAITIVIFCLFTTGYFIYSAFNRAILAVRLTYQSARV